jgi:murein DD-endopeptidase MepM/ murein hydrolase activator NlpD
VIQNGIGIAVPVGSPVRAVATGTVEYASAMGTYGPSVMLDHGGGYYTLYLYLSAFEVQTGQLVQTGQIIGRSGGAYSNEGPHIEFQIRGEDGIALDPRQWLRRRR